MTEPRPLSAEERAAVPETWFGPPPYLLLARYEGTVRAVEAERDRLAARVALLEAALREAVEFADEGWAYASDYFRERWNYAETAARLRSALADDGGPG